jgi:hypothetical protein
MIGACAARRKVLLTRVGFNEPAGGMSSRPRRGGPGMSRSSQALPGSLSSQVPMIDKPEARRFAPPFKESTLAPR